MQATTTFFGQAEVVHPGLRTLRIYELTTIPTSFTLHTIHTIRPIHTNKSSSSPSTINPLLVEITPEQPQFLPKQLIIFPLLHPIRP